MGRSDRDSIVVLWCALRAAPVGRVPRCTLVTRQFILGTRDVLLLGPPGTGWNHLAQVPGREAIRRGHTVYFRRMFDPVRDPGPESEEPGHTERASVALHRCLKPELLIIFSIGCGLQDVVWCDLPRHGCRSLPSGGRQPVHRGLGPGAHPALPQAWGAASCATGSATSAPSRGQQWRPRRAAGRWHRSLQDDLSIVRVMPFE